jgi:hypothetical protein
MRSHKHNEFLFFFREGFCRKGHTEERNVTQNGDFRYLGSRNLVLNQAADGEGLAVFQLHRCMDTLGQTTQDRTAARRQGCFASRAQLAYFRFDFQVNLAIAENNGQEIEAGPEFFKLDSNLAQAGGLWVSLFTA